MSAPNPKKGESKASWAKQSYSLKDPKKADLNKDGKISSYEKKRGEAIEKSQEGKGDKPKNKGLSDKQKKLPPALQKAIMKKQSKADMGREEQMAMIQDKISVLENHMQAVKDYMKHGK
jgi:hypothetical protein